MIKTRTNATTADGSKITTVECRAVGGKSRVTVGSFVVPKDRQDDLAYEMKALIQKYSVQSNPDRKIAS